MTGTGGFGKEHQFMARKRRNWPITAEYVRRIRSGIPVYGQEKERLRRDIQSLNIFPLTQCALSQRNIVSALRLSTDSVLDIGVILHS